VDAAARPIRFGTGGWRGVLGDEVTLARVAAVTRALADLLRTDGATGPVLVAHDRRFGGARLADVALGVLAGAGRASLRVAGAAPTPAVARAVAREGAAAALIFTASHNAPHDHGVKVLDAGGAGAGEDWTARLEAGALRALGAPPPPAPWRGRPRDVTGAYVAELVAQIDRAALRRAGLRVAYDAMHGAGAGVLDAVLARAGVEVACVRSEPDLRFGGAAPDPVPARLAPLRTALARRPRLALGVATDGDADRYAALDPSGRALSSSEALALLVDHLAACGRLRRGVAISTATGSLVERVAESHGLRVTRHPIGWKGLSQALCREEADVAGEESGGFALGGFCRDKDGILAACLLVERLARTRRAPGADVAGLEQRLGASACGRSEVPGAPEAHAALARLRAAPPDAVDGARVRAVDLREGLRLALDDGFLMLRASGTETLVRVYAEAADARGLAQRLALGRAWLAARADRSARGRPARMQIR
jgi:phosphomannomutase